MSSALKKQFSLAYKKQPACKKQPSSAVKKQFSYSNLESCSVSICLKQEASSRILQAIQKEYFSQIKYRSFLSFRISTKQRAKQAVRFSMQLNVIELRTCRFDRVARVKNVEIFSILLRKIDLFLNLAEILFRSEPDLAQISSLLNYIKLSLFYKNTKINTYNRDHCLALYQIEKKFHLTVSTTQENLEHYQQSKNVDSATILSFRCFEFLDFFSKKETDILSLYCFYNYVIYLKKSSQSSVSALYNISRNKTLELRCYLDKNLSKEFIRVSRFQTTASVLFVKKFEDRLKFYINYRDLNTITVKNQYFLSLISDFQCQAIILDSVQLNISPVPVSLIMLASIKLDVEEFNLITLNLS